MMSAAVSSAGRVAPLARTRNNNTATSTIGHSLPSVSAQPRRGAPRQAPRRTSIVTAAEGGPSEPPPPIRSDAFAQLESLIAQASAAGGSSGDRGWREVEGAWVLGPPDGQKPRAVVHFVGGAFVGASPQLTYRLFLEALSKRGRVLIIATPFGLGFDHLRIADEAQFRFDRCMRTISDEVEAGAYTRSLLSST